MSQDPRPESVASFAERQIESRLANVTKNVQAVREDPGEEPVHQLRVSIRRFFAALRTFESILPGGEIEAHRERLRPILKMAGEVRNRDIALDLATRAEVPAESLTVTRLTSERGQLAILLWRMLEGFK